VHTLGFGSGRSGAGLGRIAELFGGVADFRGLDPVRVPPRARVFPVRGFLVFLRVHIVHTLAADLMFRAWGVRETAYSGVWGPGNGLFGCVGERPATAVVPCGVFAGHSSSFVLSVGFSPSPLHGGWGRLQRDLLNIL
jgi:hypothetical protein